MAVLKVLRGVRPGELLPVEEERVLLGRHPNCQVVFDNGAISRHHAQILESHGSYYIEDLRSRNGTFLNGEPLDGRTELKDGDQIRICDIQLLFMQRGPLDESTRDSDDEMSASETTLGNRSKTGPERTTASGSSIDESKIWVVNDQVEEPEFESSSVIKRIDTRGQEAYSAAVPPGNQAQGRAGADAGPERRTGRRRGPAQGSLDPVQHLSGSGTGLRAAEGPGKRQAAGESDPVATNVR